MAKPLPELRRVLLAGAGLLLVWACRPPEPTPSRYADLGTDGEPLLPTPPVWHNPTTLKGQADWRPFRKPESTTNSSAAARPGSGVKPPEADAAVRDAREGEIRTLIGEFNDALKEGNLEEATEFMSDAQAENAAAVFEAAGKLQAQLTRVADIVPPLTEKAEKLIFILNVKESMRLEVQGIRFVNDQEAAAKLPDGSDVRFSVGDEDFWFIESPVFARLSAQREAIEKAAGELETLLAQAGSAPDETAVAAVLDPLLAALHPKESGALVPGIEESFASSPSGDTLGHVARP